MKQSIASTLLEKGWSEEEINDYFTKLYRKKARPENKRLLRMVLVANFVAILFLALMMVALALIFTGFGWSVLSLSAIVFFSAWITYRNKIIFSELFSQKRVFLLNVSISFFLVVMMLLGGNFFYDLVMLKMNGGPNSFPLAEYCIVSFAVVLAIGIFLKMFEDK